MLTRNASIAVYVLISSAAGRASAAPFETLLAAAEQRERPTTAQASPKQPGAERGAAPATAPAAPLDPGVPVEVRIYETSDVPPRLLDALRPLVGPIDTVGPGVTLVTAPAEKQALVRSALDQHRATRKERVLVEVAVRRAEGQPPAVGAAEPASLAGMPLVRYTQSIVSRGFESAMMAQEQYSYVRTLVPVIGTSSAGQQPLVEDGERGLHLRARIGAAENGKSSVALRGVYKAVSLRDAAQREPSITGASVSVPSSPLQLRREEPRLIDSEISVGVGVATVAAVVDDPEKPGSLLVFTVRIAEPPK